MLKNYDASEIAAVMGMTFIKQPKESRTRASAASPRGRCRRAAETATIAGRDASCSWRLVIRSEEPAHRVKSEAYAIVTTSDCTMPSADTMLEAIEAGFPREALRRLAVTVAGGDETKAKQVERTVVAKTTPSRRNDRLSKHQSDRTERTARLFVQAKKALGTHEEAREFMTMPHAELDGKTPLQMAQTDLGARLVEDILTALEYGLAL